MKEKNRFLNSNGNLSKARYRLFLLGSLALLFVVIIISLSVGQYKIDFATTIKILFEKIFKYDQTWTNIQGAVIWTLRWPRTLAAVLVGSALALAGASYQSLFRNPMVSPDILGVTSGACVGAATAILLGAGGIMLQFGAFVGGIIAVGLTISIPRLMKNDSTIMLVLAGIVVGSLASSVMSVIKFIADPDTKLAEITYWIMGSFSAVNMKSIYYVLPCLIIPMVILLCMRYRLNVLSLGDDEAKSLGINIRRTRGVIVVCSTVLTAASVCVAGSIGWVGLIIPHLSRMIVGADNKKMLPIALLMGATFMLFIDILCRTITTAELKISILTGIIGAPFYIFILYKQRRSLR